MPLCHVARSVGCVVCHLLEIRKIGVQVHYKWQFNNHLYKKVDTSVCHFELMCRIKKKKVLIKLALTVHAVTAIKAKMPV